MRIGSCNCSCVRDLFSRKVERICCGRRLIEQLANNFFENPTHNSAKSWRLDPDSLDCPTLQYRAGNGQWIWKSNLDSSISPEYYIQLLDFGRCTNISSAFINVCHMPESSHGLVGLFESDFERLCARKRLRICSIPLLLIFQYSPQQVCKDSDPLEISSIC